MLKLGRNLELKEINMDNEDRAVPILSKTSEPEKMYSRQSVQNTFPTFPSESLGQLVDFAEGLCKEPVVGRSRERLGVRQSPEEAILEPMTAVDAAEEASAEESQESESEESGKSGDTGRVS